MHAIEELYFEGRYKEGQCLAEQVLRDGSSGGEIRGVLERYLRRCEEKLGIEESPGKG